MTRDLEPLWSDQGQHEDAVALEDHGDQLAARAVYGGDDQAVWFTREQVRAWLPAVIAWAADRPAPPLSVQEQLDQERASRHPADPVQTVVDYYGTRHLLDPRWTSPRLSECAEPIEDSAPVEPLPLTDVDCDTCHRVGYAR